jgi:hypothetical protein
VIAQQTLDAVIDEDGNFTIIDKPTTTSTTKDASLNYTDDDDDLPEIKLDTSTIEVSCGRSCKLSDDRLPTQYAPVIAAQAANREADGWDGALKGWGGGIVCQCDRACVNVVMQCAMCWCVLVVYT